MSNSQIWEGYYKSLDAGPSGNLYPNEPLVRFVSNLRRDQTSPQSYFRNAGRENQLRLQHSGQALEIGFGHTSNLMMLAEKGFRSYGLEVSLEAVSRGNTRLLNQPYAPLISLDFWDGAQLPFDDSQLDLVISLQSCYYNLDFEYFRDEVFRVLKPGGSFFFSFFSSRHEYMNYVDLIRQSDSYDVVKWSAKHPNERIRGAQLIRFRSKHELGIFFNANNVRVFTEESDQLPMFQSWWYVAGER